MKSTYEKRTIFNAPVIVLCIGLLVSCNKFPIHLPGTNGNGSSEVIYVENNNYMNNQNAIIAYTNNGNGKLTPFSAGPFLTGGAGIGNPQQADGPNASDNEIRITDDKKFLLAVNSGSNTIAVFKIKSDGTLSAVPGSPFPSGGETPVSIDIWQQHVYVVNKSQNPITPTTTKPNFTVFTLGGDGSLTPVDSGTQSVNANASPAAVLVERNNGLVFGTEFLGLRVNGVLHATLDVFSSDNGRLTRLPGTPLSMPGARPQGMWQNTAANVVYAAGAYGVQSGVITVYGMTSYPNQNIPYYPDYKGYFYSGPGACCLRTNNTGDHMYVLNSVDNSVTVFNASNAFAPARLQKLVLKNAGPTYQGISDSLYTTSQCYSLGLSSNEKFLYVVSQHANPDFSIGNYNYLHVLPVNDDGTLSEPDDPVQLPVPNNMRPRGVAVYKVN